MQHAFVEIVELLDPAALHQMAVEAVQVAGHLQILHGGELAGGLVLQRINVNPQVLGEKLAEGLQNAAFERRVVLAP